MSIQFKLIITGLLYLLTVAGGVWTSRRGRPLNVLLNTAHKLLAVGAAVFTGLLLFGRPGFASLLPAQVAGILVILAVVALFASGAVLSGKERMKRLVAVHVAGTVAAVLGMIGMMLSFPQPVDLQAGIKNVDYAVSDSLEYRTYDDIDLYTADIEQLKRFDAIHFSRAFGPIGDAQTAASAAELVYKKIYGKPDGRFVVGFNNNAKAWIVYDELPVGWFGGDGVFAIKRDTGQVIMGYHGK